MNRLGKDMERVGRFLIETQCSIYPYGWVKRRKYFSTVYSEIRTGHLPNVRLIILSDPYLWPFPANARICGLWVRYGLHVYDKRFFCKPTTWSDKTRTAYQSQALALETRFSVWQLVQRIYQHTESLRSATRACMKHNLKETFLNLSVARSLSCSVACSCHCTVDAASWTQLFVWHTA
jgi:hypothetical protein